MKRTASSHVGVTWGLLWATFGSLWGYFGHLRVALGDLWVMLRSLWRYDAYMWGLGGAVFDLVLARQRILKGQGRPEGEWRIPGGGFCVTFVSPWCHCEVSLESLCIPLGHFEAPLGI